MSLNLGSIWPVLQEPTVEPAVEEHGVDPAPVESQAQGTRFRWVFSNFSMKMYEPSNPCRTQF
jgi:hypothetical protein